MKSENKIYREELPGGLIGFADGKRVWVQSHESHLADKIEVTAEMLEAMGDFHSRMTYAWGPPIMDRIRPVLYSEPMDEPRAVEADVGLTGGAQETIGLVVEGWNQNMERVKELIRRSVMAEPILEPTELPDNDGEDDFDVDRYIRDEAYRNLINEKDESENAGALHHLRYLMEGVSIICISDPSILDAVKSGRASVELIVPRCNIEHAQAIQEVLTDIRNGEDDKIYPHFIQSIHVIKEWEKTLRKKD